MAPNTITQKIIHAIEVYIKYVTRDDDKAFVAMYGEVCEDPAEWFQTNETLYREATDIDDLGHDVWLHGWYNIDWEYIKDYMIVEYKRQEEILKEEEEYNKSESSHSNSDSE
jgi:hypothetical protein